MRLQTKITLWKLRLRQRRSNRIFNRLVRESGKSVAECTNEQWYADGVLEDVDIEAQEKKAISDELYYEAQKLYLPTPRHDDNEQWDSDCALYSPTRYLTAEAMTELRTAIRKERLLNSSSRRNRRSGRWLILPTGFELVSRWYPLRAEKWTTMSVILATTTGLTEAP